MEIFPDHFWTVADKKSMQEAKNLDNKIKKPATVWKAVIYGGCRKKYNGRSNWYYSLKSITIHIITSFDIVFW